MPIRAIAEVLGRRLDLPVVASSAEDAGEHLGWLAGYLAVDGPASSWRELRAGAAVSVVAVS